MRLFRGIGAGALLVFALLSTGASQAAAGTSEGITRYDVDITIEPTGALLVRETIDYDFGFVPHHGIFRDIPARIDYPPEPNHDRVYPIDVLSVRGSPGTPAEYTVDTEGDNERVKIGDPDRTITGQHRYEITYRVRGALNGFTDHDELVWNAIGTDWSVPIGATTVTVHAPAAITAVNCASGQYGSNAPCSTANAAGDTATFTMAELFPGFALGPFSGMTVTIGLPKGAVPEPHPILEERFTVASAFRVTPATGGLAAAMLAVLIGAVLFLVWFFGRDRRYKGSAVDVAYGPGTGTPDPPEERVPLLGEPETPVEFVPPDGLRPGQVGTLVDFKANPLDVTATIVDLAVRGYLVIEEVSHNGLFRAGDWKLTRKKESDDSLLPYEAALLAALFKDDAEVKLSELRYKFASRMTAVRTELQEDATKRGWFVARAGTCAFAALGMLVVLVGIALTIGLALWTHAALLGVPVIIGGILLVIASWWMPRRTAKGYAVLRHVDGFRRFIEESEKDRAQFAEK